MSQAFIVIILAFKCESIAACGGNYTDAHGLIMSPSYPNQYPPGKDCTYVISQPNGTYIEILFLTMGIVCHERYLPDYIEMRDGISENSPIMGRFCGTRDDVPELMITTTNYLRIRC